MTVPTEARGRADRRMRPASRRWMPGVIAAVTTAAVALTGCGAGQNAQTASEYSVQDGVAINAGPIALRHIAVGAPSDASWAIGSSAPLYLILVNDGTSADTLQSISTPVATSVVTGPASSSSTGSSPSGSESSGSASSSESPNGSQSSSGSESSSGSPSSSGFESSGSTASPSGSGSTGASPTGGSVGGSFESIPLPATTLVTVGTESGNIEVTLAGLKQQLFPATSISITFTFAKAGAVTLKIPVRLKPDQTGGPTVDISPTGED